MSALQDFREQYPQYSDMEDEQLADALYQRYYSDMDPATYRESMGLEPLPEPEPPPTVWDRVKSVFEKKEQGPAEILSDKEPTSSLFEVDDASRQPGHLPGRRRSTYQSAPAAHGPSHLPGPRDPNAPLPDPEEPVEPRARLRDQLFAGFDELRANKATVEAFDVVDVYNNAENLARGKAWPRLDDEPADLAFKRPPAAAADIVRIRDEQVARLQQVMDRRRELSARAAQIPYHKETRDMLAAETFSEGLNEFTDDPIMIIAETSLRSLPNMAEAIPYAVGGAMVAGPWGFAGGMGAGSGMVEYRAAFAQYLEGQGVDLNDARALIDASQDDAMMRAAHDQAGKRAGIIAGASMIGAGVATKPLTPFVKNAIGRELSNVAAQTAVQTTLEGSGEALAQLATEGKVSPGDVLAEMTGSLAQAPIEVGAAAVTGVRSERMQQQALDIENEVRAIFGDDVEQGQGPEVATPVPRETSAAAEIDAAELERHEMRRARVIEEGNVSTETEAADVAEVLNSKIPDQDQPTIDIDTDQTPDSRQQIADRRQAETDIDIQERRQSQRRARLERMSLDDLVDAYYTDPMTGLGNRAAFDEEIASQPFVASIDADSLKWINDNLGHDAGDAMLAAIGESLRQADVTAYRIGGDEFYIGGQTKDQVQAALTLAEGVLANQTLTSPNGKKQGIEITGGIGQDKASADARMEVEKKRKKTRAARGDQPAGVTLSSKGAKVLDMNPGTNYVPIIGKLGDLPIDPDHNLIMGSTGKPVRIPKIPVRREHVLAVMQKYFGRRIYQGRVKGKLRLGFYRPGHGEVRIKNHNDIEVAAHEIAHFLDDRYPWIARLYKKFDKEVRSVSYDEKLIFEGWAEFMRLWMTQESEAMKRTPSFYDAFNKEAQSRDPRLWNMLVDLQELMHAWTMQGARARAASKHANQGPSMYERIRQLFPVNVVQRALDGLRSIKTIAADLSDPAQLAVTDAYERLRLATGGSNGVLEAAMFYGTPGWRSDGQGIELTGESLTNIFGDDWGDNDVALYMIGRRAQELAEQGRENLMRPDEIAAALQIGKERPDLRDKFDRYQEFNKRMLDFAEGGGILGVNQREAIEEMNKNYVPFHRIIESQIQGTQVQAGGNPFQRLSGGTQNLNNIWDNIVNNAGLVIRMSMINDGKRQLLRKLGEGNALGQGKGNQQAGVYAAKIPKDVKPVSVDRDQVLRKIVDSMGISWRDYKMAKETGMYPPGDQGTWLMATVAMIDKMQSGMEDFVQFWKFGQDPKGDNIDMYQDGDEKHFFEINDPNLMDSLRFLGPKGTNLALGILGGFSATLRRGVVAVPVFQVKNFMRDTVNAWMLSGHVKVPALRALKVVGSRMGKDPAYVEMLLNGGGFANRSQGLQAQRKVIVDPTRLAAFYDRFMGRFENANRLAEYKAARADGVSPRKSALLSREISTDFAMRGSSEVARFLAISVPFLNARAQGLYRVKRQFDQAEMAISYATRGLMLAGATMALYALNKDDERYKELPEDTKDLYYVFFTGDGEDNYVLLPKAFESGMIFSTLPERMYEFAEQENGKEFADALGWMLLQTFSMDMTPQAFQPLIDLQRNKNFTGAPIIPHYLENVEPTEQYTYYTSEAVREAAQAMGMSPIKVEHLLRGYLGTLGTYAIGAADATIRATTDDRQFGEDPTRGETWRENIVVRALVDPLVAEGPPRRTKYVTDLYDMIRESEKVANTVALHQKRTIDQLEGYLEDPEKMAQFATNEILQGTRKQLSDIRKQMDIIRQDRELSGDEKRSQLWDLTRTRNKLARNAVLQIQEAEMQAEEQMQNAQ